MKFASFLIVLILFCGNAQAFYVDEKVYAKRATLDLYDQPTYRGVPIGSAPLGAGLLILEIHGRWFYVKYGVIEGWVHRGNVSWQPLKKKHRYDLLSPEEGGSPYPLPLLSQTTMDYCDRIDHLDVVPDLQWLEEVAGQISSDEVLWFMQQRYLGDFSP